MEKQGAEITQVPVSRPIAAKTAVNISGGSVVPETASEQFFELQRIAWTVIRELEDRLLSGGSEERYLSANILAKYLSLLTNQLRSLQEILKDSQDYREVHLLKQALLDVLSQESPDLRRRVLQRLEELKAASEAEPSKRSRGRPRSPGGISP